MRRLHAIGLTLLTAFPALGSDRPNVVGVITDDQGWGDFGFHGNRTVRTPNLDQLARESARVESFYVSPVCAPTRAALMTGRWTQRTRAIDTYIGRAMMDPEEITIAEALGDSGYATGIFGKWHLGDCYPMRPQDQGFQESLVHRGGGIGQPSDPEGGEGKYTDPVLFENGERRELRGYCTDIYFDSAVEFMGRAAEAGRPFFAYIATNAPHGPFHDVPEGLLEEYRNTDLSPAAFPVTEGGHALPEKNDENKLSRIFAMITNIDEGFGRMTRALKELGIADDTIVIYMLDNGPNTRRYVGGMRGMKSDVHEGGVRSPLWIRWPARLEAGRTTDRVAAHVDVMPTLLDACGVDRSEGNRLDGRSLLPLLEGEGVTDWPDRDLVIQAHRGDRAVRYHHFLLRNQRWKLLNASGFGKELEEVEPSFELYDMAADPLEKNNLASSEPEVLAELVARYDAWFDDVSSTRPDNYAPPRIALGADEAPETHLTRQDWRRVSKDRGWARTSLGYWEVDVRSAGPYAIRVRFPGNSEVTSVKLRCGELEISRTCKPEDSDLLLEGLELQVGPGRMEVELASGDGTLFGAHQVIVTRL